MCFYATRLDSWASSGLSVFLLSYFTFSLFRRQTILVNKYIGNVPGGFPNTTRRSWYTFVIRFFCVRFGVWRDKRRDYQESGCEVRRVSKSSADQNRKGLKKWLKMAEGCGMNCIKYLVFIFNFLFAVSIWLHYLNVFGSDDEWVEGNNEESNFQLNFFAVSRVLPVDVETIKDSQSTFRSLFSIASKCLI